MAIHSAVLLAKENKQLWIENERQTGKEKDIYSYKGCSDSLRGARLVTNNKHYVYR
jgi:hypothetical protein